MSDLAGNPEDRFSQRGSHHKCISQIKGVLTHLCQIYVKLCNIIFIKLHKPHGPCTNLRMLAFEVLHGVRNRITEENRLPWTSAHFSSDMQTQRIKPGNKLNYLCARTLSMKGIYLLYLLYLFIAGRESTIICPNCKL